MRAKRRQELKTNDLAQWLEEKKVTFKDWSVYVIGGVALVAIAAMVFSYLRTAKAETVGQAYSDLAKAGGLMSAGIRKTDDELVSSLKKIQDLVDQTGDDTFALDGLVAKGSLALGSAESGGAEGAKRFLPEAREAFEKIVNQHRDHALHYGRALAGLYQVEAQAFAYDQDPAHKEKAEQWLETLRDDPRLDRTPLHAMAVDTLNSLDRIFATVTFPSRPADALSLEGINPAIQPSVTVRQIDVPAESEAAPAETPEVHATPAPDAPAAAAPDAPADDAPGDEPANVEPPAAADTSAPVGTEPPAAAGTNG